MKKFLMILLILILIGIGGYFIYSNFNSKSINEEEYTIEKDATTINFFVEGMEESQPASIYNSNLGYSIKFTDNFVPSRKDNKDCFYVKNDNNIYFTIEKTDELTYNNIKDKNFNLVDESDKYIYEVYKNKNNTYLKITICNYKSTEYLEGYGARISNIINTIVIK